MKKLIWILLGVWTLLAGLGPIRAANLVPNSSFECGTGRGWLSWGGNVLLGNRSLESRLTNDASHGRYAFLLENSYYLQSRAIELTPGPYTLTFDALGENDAYQSEVLNWADFAAGQPPRTNFTGDFTWKRFTNTFTMGSTGFVVVKFGHIRNYPLLVDAIQLEAGETATPYAPQNEVEQAITIPTTNAMHWAGDTTRIRLDLWNTGPATNVISRYDVYDAANSNVASATISISLAAETNTSEIIVLPDRKGWFRVVSRLALFSDSSDEATFNVYPFASNITASATSWLGAHSQAHDNNVRRELLAGRYWNRTLSPISSGTRWQTVEPVIGGPFVFTDAAFTNMTRDGMFVLAPLTAIDGTWPVGATNANGYWSENAVSNYCYRLVDRYDVQMGLSNSVRWEIWNEPYQSGPVGDGPESSGANKPINTRVATNYAKLALAMISGITNANPGAYIVFGGGSYGGGDWVYEAWTNMDAASRSYVDAVSTHQYGALDTEDPNTAYDFVGHFTNAKGWMDIWNGILPVWNTESGVYGIPGAMKGLNQTFAMSFDYFSSFAIEADRSGMMIRPQVSLMRQLTISLDGLGNGFAMLFYYDNRYLNDQSFGASGVVPYGSDYRQVDLPWLAALSAATRFITKGFGRIQNVNDANLWAFAFTNSSGDSVVAAWMLNRTNTIVTMTNSDFAAYDLWGNEFQEDVGDVRVTRFPIYIESSLPLNTLSNTIRFATTATVADTAPPAVSIDIAPTGLWPGSGTALIKWTAYDDTVTVLGPNNANTASTATNILTRYKLDGGSFSPYAQTNFVRLSGLSAGNHTFTVSAIDANGNVSETSYVFAPDSEDLTPPDAPVVNIVPATVTVANQAAVSITISGEVGTTVTGTVTSSGGGTPVVLGGTIPGGGTLTLTPDLSGLTDGTLTAEATLTDASSNESAAGSDTATKDATAPATPTVNIVPTFVNLANETAVNITVAGEVGATVSGTVSSSGGGTPVILSGTIPGGGTLSANYDLSGLSDGTLTAGAVLTDAAGNSSSAGVDTATTMDTVAPATPTVNIVPTLVTIVNQASVSVTVSGEVGATVSGSITSSGGGTPVTLSGTIPGGGTLSSSYNVTGLSDGTLTASATLTDAASNTSGAGTDTATKDTVSPLNLGGGHPLLLKKKSIDGVSPSSPPPPDPPDEIDENLIAYYACEQQQNSAYLTNALGSNNLVRTGSEALTNVGIIGTAIQVTTNFTPTYTLDFPHGTFVDFTNDFCIRFWYYYDANSDALVTIASTPYWRISYVAPDTIRFRSDMGSATPTTLDSSAMTPDAWHRVVVWHENGVGTGIKIDNDAATTDVFATLMSIDPGFDPSNLTVAGRNQAFTDNRIDEIAIWRDYIPTADELLADWNSGAGRTYPW